MAGVTTRSPVDSTVLDTTGLRGEVKGKCARPGPRHSDLVYFKLQYICQSHATTYTHSKVKCPLSLALLALGPRRSSISSDAIHEIPEVVDHLEVRVAAALHLERAHAPSARRASSDPALDVGARVVPFDRRDVGVQADRVLRTLDLVYLACRRRRGVRESVATTVSGARWGLKMGWHVAHVA